MRQSTQHLSLFTLALLLCAGSMAILAGCDPFETPPIPIGDPEPVVLKLPVISVEKSSVDGRHAIAGTLQASRQVKIAPRLSARITEILVREGSFAKKGTPMVKLDGRDLVAKKTQAMANVAALQQKLDYLNVQQARIEKLGKQGVAPPTTVDEINVSVLTTASQLVAAKGVLAEVESAFEDLIVRAPFDGWVNQRFAEVGDFALPSEPLMIFEDKSRLKATLSISTDEALRLKQTKSVQVRVDGVDGLREAVVTAVLASGVGRIPGQRAIVELNNDQGDLAAGSVLRLELSQSGDRATTSVPQEAIEERDGWSGVYAIKEGRLLFNWVTMETDKEIQSDGKVKVIFGLKPGDQIVSKASLARESGLIGKRVIVPPSPPVQASITTP